MKKCFALRVPVSFTASLIVEEGSLTGAWEVSESIVLSMIKDMDDNVDVDIDNVKCDYDETITIAAPRVIIPDKG